MRGKPLQLWDLAFNPGITPADAGKTSGAEPIALCLPGSPPRMRGKPNDETSISAHTGITPADAGKTFWVHSVRPRVQDHPRGCGENAFFANLSRLRPGSPPRMRGKLLLHMRKVAFRRITPADAGKTL